MRAEVSKYWLLVEVTSGHPECEARIKAYRSYARWQTKCYLSGAKVLGWEVSFGVAKLVMKSEWKRMTGSTCYHTYLKSLDERLREIQALPSQLFAGTEVVCF